MAPGLCGCFVVVGGMGHCHVVAGGWHVASLGLFIGGSAACERSDSIAAAVVGVVADAKDCAFALLQARMWGRSAVVHLHLQWKGTKAPFCWHPVVMLLLLRNGSVWRDVSLLVLVLICWALGLLSNASALDC